MLSLDEVRRVAKLAALELSDEEAEVMRGELGAILAHIAALDALDVAAVEPTSHPFALATPLRADEPQLSGVREPAFAAAPRVEDGGFAVPKVLDGD
jgi:aspartyl-tRNA(Asn)/glutamyl-tRNA(Gln) amidotransferase subunit C